MAYSGVHNEVAISSIPFLLQASRGKVIGISCEEKFGRNPDVDTATAPEDVWTAGGIWVAPTQARVHNIVSTSPADDGDPVGTGARTVRIHGLKTWALAETTEDVILNGTTNVATAESYVIIHRMRVLTAGSGGTNAGIIRATAQSDNTVTAEIAVGDGQTQMAIYGIPAKHEMHLTNWYMTMDRSTGSTASVDFSLLVQENAGDADALFVIKNHHGLISVGGTHVNHIFPTLFKVTGPAIIKVQVENVSANDTDVNGGFDGFLVDTTKAT